MPQDKIGKYLQQTDVLDPVFFARVGTVSAFGTFYPVAPAVLQLREIVLRQIQLGFIVKGEDPRRSGYYVGIFRTQMGVSC